MYAHPSISLYQLTLYRIREELDPIPAVIEQEVGYTLDRSTVYHKADKRRKITIHI